MAGSAASKPDKIGQEKFSPYAALISVLRSIRPDRTEGQSDPSQQRSGMARTTDFFSGGEWVAIPYFTIVRMVFTSNPSLEFPITGSSRTVPTGCPIVLLMSLLPRQMLLKKTMGEGSSYQGDIGRKSRW